MIAGENGNDSIDGGGSADYLFGGQGSDTLHGGDGDDVLASYDVYPRPDTPFAWDFSFDVDWLWGDAGDDQLIAGYGDMVDGGSGLDSLFISYLGLSSGIYADYRLLAGQYFAAAGITLNGIESVAWLQGSNFDDFLAADPYNYEIDGLGGNDHIIGSYLVDGGAGNDLIEFGPGAADETIGLGGRGNDTLIGGGDTFNSLEGEEGDDLLAGGQLADKLDGGRGNDLLDGGDGADTASYSNEISAVQADLALNWAHADRDNSTDTLLNIENLVGGSSNDALSGNNAANRIDGGDGDDTLTGRGGADTLAGGMGDDTFVITGTETQIIELAGQGSDTVVSQGSLTLGEDLENLRFLGDGAANGVGNALANMLTGNSAFNALEGAAGNDTLAGGAGADTLLGGDGDDDIYSSVFSPVPALGDSSPTLLLDTGSEADLLQGGEGDDRLFAGYGDTVDGGEHSWLGNMLYISFMGASQGVQADFRSLSLESANVGSTTISNIQYLQWLEGSNYDDLLAPGDGWTPDFAPIYGRGGNDHIIVGAVSGVVDGGEGDDLIDNTRAGASFPVYGGAGNDTILGGGNTARLDGGDGNDVITGAWRETVSGGAGNDLLNGLADEQYGDAGNDTLTGGLIMDGGAGNDLLLGDDGPDIVGSTHTLLGGAGADTLEGGRHGGALDGGSGSDVAIFQRALADYAITYDSATQTFTVGDLGADGWQIYTVTGVEIFRFADVQRNAASIASMFGSDGDELFSGDSEADFFDAKGGNDTIHGGGGDDTLIGGEGDDVIDGGAGSDTLSGGDGLDFAFFGGWSGDYTIKHTSTGFVVTSTYMGDIDVLLSVERVVFNDMKVALDISGNAGQAYRLYQAAFDRVPDLPGLGYQMHDLDIGRSITDVAANFIASPEFQSTYGYFTDAEFVTQLYRNVLNREPEAVGLAYHVNRMAMGASRADILVGFSESPENQANVIGAIQDGIPYVW